ncbi:uncharacterized protein LOC115693658 [Syzygium oleosum]|uniref:uncharacterized protein LOC115693658 n=1 Tax=Syzygium oleosum TaxID=219896 RepID=UPI0024B9110F|nr:uncharacterized protein LOC115693658 [Syzygium oleosum]XP_056161831.1 uncharacterized protein LOC115693658 [Syzygium oleosum]
MDSEEDILGSNSVEDVAWLCSLSESELDLLMSLKALALQRARVIGREHLAERFDLKMLRAMGMILMEHLKGKVKDLEGIPGLAGSASHLDTSNLLKSSLENGTTLEDIKACLDTHLKKGPLKRQREEVTPEEKRQDDEM